MDKKTDELVVDLKELIELVALECGFDDKTNERSYAS